MVLFRYRTKVLEVNMYIEEMANHLLNNRLTLFVGAGFSRLFGFPSWTKLLTDIIDTYELRECLVDTNLFYFLDENEYDNAKEINDEILEKLLGVDYLRLAGYIDYLLRENHKTSIHNAVLDSINEYEETREKNDNYNYLVDFFHNNREYFEDIITTNYDTNIELCFNWDISVINRNLSSLNKISGKNKLFKIHGCVSDDSDGFHSEIVITEKDYNDFNNNNKYLFYKLYSFFTEKKIVFIGYSINDPNIRFLLNQVIEENAGKVGLDIFWINRDTLNVLDKKYYEDQFKLKIIENTDIIEFFKQLDERKEKNLEIREIIQLENEEYGRKFLRNYKEQALVDDAIAKGKLQDVLGYLYSRIIEDNYRVAVRAYLKLLLVASDEVLESAKRQIKDVFSLNNEVSLYIILESYIDDEVRKFIVRSDYITSLLKAYGDFSLSSHPFGTYATCIEATCKAINMYKDNVEDLPVKLLDGLRDNIKMSCTSSVRYLGYDWGGLYKVKQYINLLEAKMVRRLIKKLTSRYLDDMQKYNYHML